MQEVTGSSVPGIPLFEILDPPLEWYHKKRTQRAQPCIMIYCVWTNTCGNTLNKECYFHEVWNVKTWRQAELLVNLYMQNKNMICVSLVPGFLRRGSAGWRHRKNSLALRVRLDERTPGTRLDLCYIWKEGKSRETTEKANLPNLPEFQRALYRTHTWA